MIRTILAAALFAASFAANAQWVTSGTQTQPVQLPGPLKSGRFYGAAIVSVPVNSAIGAANRLSVLPVFIGTTSLLKTLSFDIGTGNAAAWNARMCVFADTGAGLPGALAVDSGTVVIGSGSVTGIQTATIAAGGVTLSGPAWYWVGWMADNLSESVFSINNAGTMWNTSTAVGFASASNLYTNVPTHGYFMAQTFGACPGSFSGTPTDSAGQVVPYVAMGY